MSDKDSLLDRLLGNAEKFTAKQATETLEMLVSEALKRGASDIHIEPHEDNVVVRYRIDGDLRPAHELPGSALKVLMVEFKKTANLDPAETVTPQEGEYAVKDDSGDVEVRLSTMPVYGGEKAVLHLSLQSREPQKLEDLGFWGENLKLLKSMLTSPHGLVVVAAPRHSGLSSTLFSLASQLSRPTRSVAAVEMRPTYRLPGVSHTYLSKSGLSMSEGLRAALKQDPNVLLLDDVPDGPTAREVVQAAADGHLVLAGLRADSSLAATLRLRAAGAEPYVLAHAWRLGIGQRLVRRLCPECRECYEVSAEEQRSVESNLGLDEPAKRRQLHSLEQAAANAGLGAGEELNSNPGHITHLWRAKAGGCNACDHTGYQGRMSVVEVLARSDGLDKGLMSPAVFSAANLQALVVKDGFIPMAWDGLVKALRGQVAVQDVLSAST